MTNSSPATAPLPLHELIAHLLAPEASQQMPETITGTMQWLNRRLASQPKLDFINATLRGIGQVIFANNPVSGFLILLAMTIESPWLGLLALLGTVTATFTAMLLNQIPIGSPAANRGMIQNGIFGLNGMLVGAAMGFFGTFGNGEWNVIWLVAAIALSALSAFVMQTVGVWFTSRFRVAPLGIPFIGVMMTFLVLIAILPQSLFDLGPPPSPFPESTIDGSQLIQSLPLGLAQVYFSSNLTSVALVVLAIAICTPMGALVGLLGCAMYLLAGLVMRARPDEIYLGLWGYNAVLTAMAIGGTFYTPTRLSIALAGLGAFLASVLSWLLVPWFGAVGLPILAVPFVIVTIGIFLILQRSIPSLVPVALHTVASPEEHRQRFEVAQGIIAHFRRDLAAAIAGDRQTRLFDRASPSTKSDLRYIFDTIDQDRSSQLSLEELSYHLQQSSQDLSKSEIGRLFKGLDRDKSHTIDFAEFGELMLRHRQLMAKYDDFVTYFLPIDANEDDTISLREINVAMASVSERPLSSKDMQFLQNHIDGQPLTWNRFIELLLVI
ncbi:urea transporter [Leptolyngbya cf. ectocarpi LEGE 11479]|uniref:Urea transporter n=1 Tax=Leptolyngbya cf. ectocarpi LEGE 11479 TaxID=1828722 RepID=A0A928X249_LEPEC|nr:urea transporter [Leptolyngbya ectocarpi]MBE9065658.1 urea transporter [Leptolyngbya cf. ectocarpi LEGE 11479]